MDQPTSQTFRSILFERLERQGISREVAEIVLEELTISTSIYFHKQRVAARIAGRAGRVIDITPIDNNTGKTFLEV